MMRALEQLGEFVATHRADGSARPQIGRKVRQHLADTVGAWIAASVTAEGKALIRHYGKSREPAGRIALHCALARSSEVDDIHLAAMITPGAIVVPAALIIANALKNDSVDDLEAAVVVGYEAMIRLGVAIDGPTVLYRGIWPTYFAAPVGAAAVYARLARLDAAQTSHALALALTMASPGVGHQAGAATSRWFALGRAVAKGFEAARAAQAGFTSDLNLLDGDFLPNVYKIAPNAAAISSGAAAALSQVSFKPWCAARQTMAATQALREILDEGVDVSAIESIDVAVLPPHLRMINHGISAGDRISHLTSAPYHMAVAALAPDAAYRLSPPAQSSTPALASFMARITVRADDGLLAAGYPQSWPAEVTFHTRSGSHRRRVTQVPGDPARPLGDDDLQAKFCRIVAPILGDAANGVYARSLAALDRPARLLQEIEEICTGDADRG